MTRLNTIRTAILTAVSMFAPAVLLAQTADPFAPPASATQANQHQQVQPATTSMQDPSSSVGMTGQMMKDKIFLRKAAAGGMAEIQLGQLAVQKADSADVKAFGQKMVIDHTALNESMKPIADSLGVMLPKKISKENQAEFDKLNTLSGTDFDTEYITFMVRDHHKDLREFRSEAEYAADPTLKDAVTKAADIIRGHTVMIEKLAKDKGIQTPGSKPTPIAAE
jgi:putative membrane protein